MKSFCLFNHPLNGANDFCLFNRPLNLAEPKFAQADKRGSEDELLNINLLTITKTDNNYDNFRICQK